MRLYGLFTSLEHTFLITKKDISKECNFLKDWQEKLLTQTHSFTTGETDQVWIPFQTAVEAE